MIKAKTIKFKQTGIDWMPEVPEHWDVKRLGGLFEERNETVSENDYTPLSVTMKGIVPQLESAAKTMHVDNRKKVCIGDFAINSRSDRRGSGGKSDLEGSVSIVNTVLKPSKFYVHEYTHFLLTNKLFQDEYYAKGKGIVADMWSTRFSEMKTIYLPVPPKDEQDEIVQYIKAQEEKINLFIQKKQRFIELLKEQRQSKIDEAIYNPLITQKTKLKYVGRFINGFAFNSLEFKNEGITKVIKISNIQPMKMDWSDISCIDDKYYESLVEYRAVKGDLVFALTRPIIKDGVKVAFIDSEERILVNQRNAILKPSNEVSKEWLYYTFLTFNFIKDFESKIDKTGQQPNISTYEIGNIKIPLPPIEEQKQIVSHIKTETATIDTAIAKAEREIELIREYKEAMITEAVMGKRK